jgi:5-hydroxyisourate hydrolase-like protein (transthyretin family)
MFTNISYLIEALRYGFLFNTTLTPPLPTQAWNNITITAPKYTMSIHVTDSHDASALGLKVEAFEWSSGTGELAQPAVTTDNDGNVTLSLTFGRYRLRLYKGDAFINEVTIDLTKNQSSSVVRIDTYNITLNVHVVDYFGQPISNVLVTFQRKVNSNYQATENQTTGADGVASFSDIIGGDSRVLVSVAGNPNETQDLHLVGPTRDVVFKMDGYVAVVGYALETSQFVTIIMLLILIVSFIIASTYKRLLRLLQRRKR